MGSLFNLLPPFLRLHHAPSTTQWDPASDQLAILPAGCTVVFIWSAASKEVQKIDTEFKASTDTPRAQGLWVGLEFELPTGMQEQPKAGGSV